MRYANIVFAGKEKHNLGDNLQLMSIDNLYKSMGLGEKEIIKIPYNELSTWYGKGLEKVILPINFPFLEYKEKGLSGLFSKKIIPVFLGLTLLNNYISKEDIAFLKEHEPIGCRDEYTYNNLKREGIVVWLNGCMTLTMFNKRTKEHHDNAKNVLIIDICNRLLEHIPEHIKENATNFSQIVTLKDNESINEYVSHRYKMYNEKAKLVITSRLHCAVPCIAMGIPVVIAVEKVSCRFSWLEKFLPIYTPEKFDSIDWNPNLINCKKIKNLMLQNAINRISDTSFKFISTYEISNFWLIRKKSNYHIDGYEEAIESISKFGAFEGVEYAFWGMTVISVMINQYIKYNFPTAKLKHVFDKYRKIKFEGLTTKSIKSFEPEKLQNLFIFVTASAATHEAIEFFHRINKNEKYCICYQNLVMNNG